MMWDNTRTRVLPFTRATVANQINHLYLKFGGVTTPVADTPASATFHVAHQPVPGNVLKTCYNGVEKVYKFRTTATDAVAHLVGFASPSNNDSITVNLGGTSTTITYVTSGASGNQVNIGSRTRTQICADTATLINAGWATAVVATGTSTGINLVAVDGWGSEPNNNPTYWQITNNVGTNIVGGPVLFSGGLDEIEIGGSVNATATAIALLIQNVALGSGNVGSCSATGAAITLTLGGGFGATPNASPKWQLTSGGNWMSEESPVRFSGGVTAVDYHIAFHVNGTNFTITATQWRNGTTPGNATAEALALKNYIVAHRNSTVVATIDGGDSTKINLVPAAFHTDDTMTITQPGTVITQGVSVPALPASGAGGSVAIGKLVGITGSLALIKSSKVISMPLTTDVDFTNNDGLLEVTNGGAAVQTIGTSELGPYRIFGIWVGGSATNGGTCNLLISQSKLVALS